MRLQIRTPGDLETLELVACDRVAPGPGQIEVAVSASSINFADVLVAFGRYPAFEGRLPQLGTDFAGVVTAVGPDVTGHRVGDQVGGLCADGCWGTFLTCDARLAVTLPAGLTVGQAAAVSTAHATAYHGLRELARIKVGDRVLIHSATGGVGQAAIAIARSAGAEIFATAGSQQRRELLRDLGIEHVYDSRSLEFADLIRRDTEGYGVDIVLNSVTGPAQRAGLGLLACGGRFVEVGKRDIYGGTRLELFPFRRNLAFYGVDVGLLAHTDPDRLRDLLTTVYQLVADGSLPMPDSTHYPLADAATAIRLMSSAQHAGKLVLDVPHSGRARVVVPPAQARVFRGDGAYIVTGGLGGLGLFLAEKMACPASGAGCGRIVLSSRSQPTPEALATIQRIRAIGADVVVECGDIAQPDTAARLVAAATATGLPVRGVLHAAAVVEDATLTNITDELLERDWAPKVDGAWNLHKALHETEAEQPLDWFCSFSSAAALVGSPGQGAYAAANSWLDAFTLWRRAQGLPATAIAWGAWSQIGRATAFAEDAGVAIAADDGAYAFEALLRHDRAYTGYTPFTGAPWLTAFAQRSPFAEAFRSTSQNPTGTGKLRAELNELPPDEWPTLLRRLISDQISLILRRSVDPDRALSEYGLDSLGALELRTRIETETGIRLTPSDITTGTVRGLAEQLCEKLAPAKAASFNGPASNGDARPDNRLAVADHALFTGHRATGQEVVIQVVWLYEHPIDFEGLRRFHRNLGYGLLGRRIERSPLPFARHRWVLDRGPSDIDIAECARPRAELSDWIDERSQVPTDPECGPGWHLGVLPLTDGSTAVSLVVSHYLIDGLGLDASIADAILGNTRDLGYPPPRSRTRLRALVQDARQTARDAPEVARALVAGAKQARRRREEIARSPASRPVDLRGGDGDDAVVVPAITIHMDLDDWDARAKALSGTRSTLVAGLAAKLGERMGRRRAGDGAVTLHLPMSDRAEGDTRAMSVSYTSVSVDPTRVMTDLRDVGAAINQALRTLRQTPDESSQLLWLASFTPKRAWERMADTLAADPDLPVFCSYLGDTDSAICRLDGTDAECAYARAPGQHVTRRWLERLGGQLAVLSGRIGGKIFITVSAYQPGAENTKPALRELAAQTLAEFGLTGDID